MTTESGEQFQTLFDEKRLYRLLSVQEQDNGTFIFQAELIHKEERGMSDKEREKARNEELRRYSKERLEGDLQMGGYILIGWYQGGCIAPAPNYKKSHGFIKSPGKAAYRPVTGSRWVYIWETYGEDAPHSNPVWGNKRFTHFTNTAKKPQRITTEKMRAFLSAPKPPYDGPHTPHDVWMPAAPLWLLDNKKDMRPLYLAGGQPE
jgi:hypothetical protein